MYLSSLEQSMPGTELTKLIWGMEIKHTIKEAYYFDKNRQLIALTGFFCLSVYK
jgi:hypothetical protein